MTEQETMQNVVMIQFWRKDKTVKLSYVQTLDDYNANPVRWGTDDKQCMMDEVHFNYTVRLMAKVTGWPFVLISRDRNGAFYVRRDYKERQNQKSDRFKEQKGD